MPSFNCYIDQSSQDDALLRPWPKCGIESLPTSISGTVTYSGNSPCFTSGTYHATWFQNNRCSTTYITLNHPVAIDINFPAFMPGQYDTGGDLFGFISNYITTYLNSGSCVWDGSSWVFSAGWAGFLVIGTETCSISVEITGVG